MFYNRSVFLHMFKKQITKEEILNYPISKYEGEIVLIDQISQVAPAIKEILEEKIIGLDTETKPSFTKGTSYKTSLIQIACSKKVFLFRINKIGFPDGLAKIFESKKTQKIGIAVVQDLKEIKGQYSSFNAHEIIDLNVLCKNIGFENIGAKNLSAMILGFSISKGQQTSNWENNELTKAQKDYAATDAWICREIFIKLMKE